MAMTLIHARPATLTTTLRASDGIRGAGLLGRKSPLALRERRRRSRPARDHLSRLPVVSRDISGVNHYPVSGSRYTAVPHDARGRHRVVRRDHRSHGSPPSERPFADLAVPVAVRHSGLVAAPLL